LNERSDCRSKDGPVALYPCADYQGTYRVFEVEAVPLEVCIGFLLAWIITIGLPGKGIFRSILTAPLFTMEVAIGYLGVRTAPAVASETAD
jgi:hypothetical protein